jgi:hypothetical protein
MYKNCKRLGNLIFAIDVARKRQFIQNPVRERYYIRQKGYREAGREDTIKERDISRMCSLYFFFPVLRRSSWEIVGVYDRSKSVEGQGGDGMECSSEL